MQAPGLALAVLAVRLVVRADPEGAWCYDSQDPECGPTHWEEMAPACGGPLQSPINIDLHQVQQDPTLGPFIFQGYDSAPPGLWTLENDGHTVLLRLDAGPQSLLGVGAPGCPPRLPCAAAALPLGGLRAQPGWRRRAMEMHVVHVNTGCQGMGEARGHPDGLTVLAEQDADNPNFSALVSGLKNVSWPDLAATFPLASLLPGASSLSRYFRYSGSLTTPGCEPAVLWTIFEDPVPIGRAQVAQFRKVPQAGPPGSRPAPLMGNIRPQQPLAGRRVSASPGASVRATAIPSTHTRASTQGALLGLRLGLWLWGCL